MDSPFTSPKVWQLVCLAGSIPGLDPEMAMTAGPLGHLVPKSLQLSRIMLGRCEVGLAHLKFCGAAAPRSACERAYLASHLFLPGAAEAIN